MKIFNNIYKYSIAVLLAMTSCVEHEIDSGGEHGYVDLKVAMDASLSVVPVARSSAGAGMPVALTIYDAKGTICREIEDFTNMDSPLSLLTGKYSVRAVVGTESSVPFTYEPCYTGRTDFEVKANVVSSADIVCTLATTKVTVTLSEQIKDNFSYSLELTNGPGTEVIDRTTPDDREIYFMVTGSLSWVLTLENADGERFTLTDTYSSVAAAQHYDLHFSLDTTDMGKLGAGEFSIIVDDSLSDPKIHDITIVIDKSAPVIDGQSSVSKSLSDQYTEGVYTVTSVLPLTSVAVSHSDAALLQAGLPQNVDLFTDRYALMMLQDAGVEVLIYSGAVIQPSVDDETTEIRLDFSGLINALPIGQYAFTISSSNTTGKVEAMDVNVNVLSSLASPSLEPWAEFIYVKGSWTSDVRPDGLKVQYRLSGAEQWTDFVPSEATGEIFYDDRAKTYRAFVCGLASSSAYELRVLSDRECLDSRSVTTDKSEQLYNMSFDEWSDDGKNPYANGKQGIWDTANPGTAISIINITPTTPESDDKIYGKAVRMESMYKMKFAAGNIYTGQFKQVNVGKMGAELDWGVPFNARPVGMSGWYKYTPVKIDRTGDGYESLKGQMDKCQILFGLFTNWTSRFPIKTYEGNFVDFSAANQDIVATNEILDGSTDGKWKNFTLYAGYRKNTFRKSPTYIVTVACASYKGDYFTGGEGSLLLVDEFEYIYDPMKLKPEDRAAFFGLFD